MRATLPVNGCTAAGRTSSFWDATARTGWSARPAPTRWPAAPGMTSFYGEAGDDVYQCDLGDGNDTISERYHYTRVAGGTDILRFGVGIEPSGVTLSRDNSSLFLTIAATGERVTVAGQFSDPTLAIERVEFADGTVWDGQLLMRTPWLGTSGNNALYGAAGDDVIHGLGGYDSLYGGDGDDVLDGGTEADRLRGEGGADTLIGGAGDDQLYGEAGDDVYVFNAGDGNDTIRERYTAYSQYGEAGGTDALRLGAGIVPSDVSLSRDSASLYLTIGATGERITIYSHFSDPEQSIERVEFADGTVWDKAVLDATPVMGSDSRDYLYGAVSDDRLIGLGGNDTLYGRGGADTLIGGTGNDWLNGEDGDDSYVFALGDGSDTIIEAAGTDTLRFGAGITPADIQVQRAANNLTFLYANGSDRVTISGFYYGHDRALERVEFVDGTVWTMDDFVPRLAEGSSGSELVGGSTIDETLVGHAGADTMSGRGGDDVYLFARGHGYDTIREDGFAGDVDVVRFAEGIAPADVVLRRNGLDLHLEIAGTSDGMRIENWFGSLESRVELVVFADGTVWDTAWLAAAPFVGTASNETVRGTDDGQLIQALDGHDTVQAMGGDDTLVGGAGNDVLQGGLGGDVYVFARGDGYDTITEDDTPESGSIDTIRFADGILSQDVSPRRDGPNLFLELAGTSDGLKVANWFSSDTRYRVEQVSFSDGTVWSAALLASAPFRGTLSNDTLFGTEDGQEMVALGGQDHLYGRGGDDTLRGGDGGDNLYGESGADTMDGGAGNDDLIGGGGADVYLLDAGYGADTIRDSGQAIDGDDVARFGDTVLPSDIILRRNGTTLYLEQPDNGDSLAIVEHFAASGAGTIERVEFSDGTVWTQDMLATAAFRGTDGAEMLWGDDRGTLMEALGGSDQIYARSGDDTVLGGDGNDALNGEAGNDTLDGGAGNDRLEGGLGDDVYVFAPGSGQDTVYEGSYGGGADTIRMAAGVAPDDVLVGRYGTSLILLLEATGDRLEVQGHFSGAAYQVEALSFADGTVRDMTALTDLPTIGSVYGDYMRLSDLGETVRGLGGNDTIYAYGGADTLSGGADLDYLYAGGGADTLIGGAGDDYLSGSSGDDTYVVGLGCGQDWLSDNTGEANVISFTSGVAASDLTFQRSTSDHDDLIVSWNGGADRITLDEHLYTSSSNTYHRFSHLAFADGTSVDLCIASIHTGSAGAETLVGGAGADWMTAAYGDDVVDGGLGNDLLLGGAGADVLAGGAGDDVLNGEAGNDLLQGGQGQGVYAFTAGGGADVVQESDGLGSVAFGGGLTSSDLWFLQTGSDLEARLVGLSDRITIAGWYDAPEHQVEAFRTSDGQMLVASDVQKLVDAMAAFAPPDGTEADLTPDVKEVLAPTLAAAWQAA